MLLEPTEIGRDIRMYFQLRSDWRDSTAITKKRDEVPNETTTPLHT
jgi:hypothetical protein